MKYRWSRCIIIALAAATARAQEPGTFGATARELLARATDRPLRAAEREAVERIYAPAGGRAIWSVMDTGPTRQALAVMDVLASAEDRGLESASYGVATLRVLAAEASRSPADAARFDVALTRAVTTMVADLHMGRIDPTTVRFDLPSAHDRVDLAAVVMSVAGAGDVAAAVSRAEPPYDGYRALQRALGRYRALAADPSLRLPRRMARTIRPGDAYPDAPVVARLLEALGDLDSVAAPGVAPAGSVTAPRYDGAVVDAIVRFQRRHGLEPDRAIGPATMAQLRVPLAQRVRQIELTLERWRWLPDVAPSRYVVVNIPGFRLYAFEDDSAAGHPALEMNVIVGEAEGSHDTPVFTATMKEVVFLPYWDVPPRIARTELIPIFRRRPAYFDSEGFEIVRRNTADVEAETFRPTSANLARVVSGELRLRQRPGPANALGFVKFLFPNRYNVYLHGTPAQELFAHSRRDFSHGCIRTERPSDLAELVLVGQAPWTREAIDSVMNGDTTVHVPIARPVSVFVLYATAVVDAAGVVSFYPDLYRHDAALERALRLTPVSASPPAVVSR
jgi:murein L,D-transpeptidase YcbB/YkuD